MSPSPTRRERGIDANAPKQPLSPRENAHVKYAQGEPRMLSLR
jgi:hypothetical protein